MTDKEIAREFGVTVPTVRTYWQRLRAKTNARSRTQATCAVLYRIWRRSQANRDAEPRRLPDA